MLTWKAPKSVKKYSCKKCDYSCKKKNDWARHLATTKHKMLTNANKKAPKSAQSFACDQCSREYRHRSSLCRHKKNCKKTKTKICLDIEEIKKENVNDSTTIIGLLKELIKIRKVPVVSQNTQNISINVFLNQHCKDAINLKDFIKNIKLTNQDLLNTKQVGYVGGISTIFIKNLNNLPVPKRPIHCSDTKRLKFYIKEEGGWNPDTEDKVEEAIGHVTMKQIRMLEEWQNNNPNYIDDPILRHEWHDIVQNIMGGASDMERIKNRKNIKRTIGEEISLREAIMGRE